MNTKEILAYLRKALGDVPRLKQLHYDNQESKLWQYGIEDILRANFGEDSTQYKRSRVTTVGHYQVPESVHQRDYLYNLSQRETALRAIIQTLELLGGEDGVEKVSPSNTEQPVIFIAHGGRPPALQKLKDFLEALGLRGIIAEEEASESRSANMQVEWCLDGSDCAVILATKGDIDGRTGDFIPRGNILIEVGRCQERFPDKTIYLLEEGAKFPSNVSEKVWERFIQENMEGAFLKVVKELRAFGFIHAGKTN